MLPLLSGAGQQPVGQPAPSPPSGNRGLTGLASEASRLLDDPRVAAQVLAAAKDEALRRCATDGWFWTSFVKTRDEADVESVKAFPRLEYLRELWQVLEANQRIAIAKSRQMMVSWLLCVYCVWFARFHANRYVIWQSQKKEDAQAMVCMPKDAGDAGGYLARMQFIETNLPSWMRLNVRESAGSLDYPNGSRIEAVAGGANQVRGKTASLLVEDEFAHQEEAKGVYQAVGPLIQKATRFVAISTPNGPDNTFAEIYHGYKLVNID